MIEVKQGNVVGALLSGEVVELNEMRTVEEYKLCYHNMVCAECYDNLESEEELK